MPAESALESTNTLGILEAMRVREFTVFKNEEFHFSRGINVIVGENGAGKTHLLKLAYAASKALYPDQASRPVGGKEDLSKLIADRLLGVFLPDSLGRLCRRAPGRQRSEVSMRFSPQRRQENQNLSFSFSTNSISTVTLDEYPSLPSSPVGRPIFLPTREMISLSPDFVRDFQLYATRFDETYYDLSVALLGGLKPGARQPGIRALVEPLENAMGGRLSVTKGSGRIYLKLKNGGAEIEMPLLAEGLRKIAMLAFLILNNSLSRNGTVYWDEPETNLNPALMRGLSEVLVELACSGVQLFIATHNLFLMREIALQIQQRSSVTPVEAKYFSLTYRKDELLKEESSSIDELSSIPALDEAIKQDERLDRQYWDSIDAGS